MIRVNSKAKKGLVSRGGKRMGCLKDADFAAHRVITYFVIFFTIMLTLSSPQNKPSVRYIWIQRQVKFLAHKKGPNSPYLSANKAPLACP
mmetsp:Transcript_31994/g.46509  ORF Transcript_31994/g.46509 Transcript_31994/m.46509 type:complete len:90 (-) Transcript_31994:747-1016(-)